MISSVRHGSTAHHADDVTGRVPHVPTSPLARTNVGIAERSEGENIEYFCHQVSGNALAAYQIPPFFSRKFNTEERVDGVDRQQSLQQKKLFCGPKLMSALTDICSSVVPIFQWTGGIIGCKCTAPHPRKTDRNTVCVALCCRSLVVSTATRMVLVMLWSRSRSACVTKGRFGIAISPKKKSFLL